MMKNLYAFVLLCLGCVTSLYAQTTVTVPTPSSYTYLSGSCGVTFVVKNNNSYDVVLTDVGMYRNTASATATYKLWVSSSSLSGSSTVQTPTWTEIANANPGSISTNALHPIFSNLTYVIPANATLRFCVQSSSRVDYSTSNSNTVSGGGLTVYIGNYQISGMNVGYAGSGTNISLGNNPRYFHGSITFAPACEGPSNISASNITTTDADISWNSVSGSLGYEYVLDQNPGNPAGPGTPTLATSHHAGGLQLNTTYYFHIRNKCTNSFSSWVTYSFTSADAYCKPPVNILYSNLGSKSVDVLWSMMPTADHYEYYYDLSPAIPAPTANVTSTASISANLVNLTPETKYYFFVRSICLGGNDSSTWRVDSFVTKAGCNAPVLNTTVAGNKADVWWNSVPLAIAYEYQLTTSEKVPAFGTEIYDTTLSLNMPDDNTDQYLHVRAKCNSQFSFSDWSTEQVRYATNGIAHGTVASSLYVYPNPVHDKLVIAGAKDKTIVITDMKGVVVMTETPVTEKYIIDCSALVPGIYIINVRGNDMNEKIRFVKQNVK